MSDNKFTLPLANAGTIRYEVGRSCSRYLAKQNGIVEEWDVFDQYGEKLHGVNRLILPKEAFIAAYNAYIKGDK